MRPQLSAKVSFNQILLQSDDADGARVRRNKIGALQQKRLEFETIERRQTIYPAIMRMETTYIFPPSTRFLGQFLYNVIIKSILAKN
ncbi:MULTISPECIES: hypothetical protein [unclassified Rhizobium]|uniref:hypothetical protein n=1 Tax=unclassified Rhizobium TaxID=2613769 RepID=UPI001ADAF1AB|nr:MULTISPECIES: hypothetical protein [unclassified Rhizobium]MBO9096576.1 hypothetical protein [Rhizobium sp. L58/93]MBO9136344.1 hypothetical protein [Rhizobium sp. B209b/85]MBO9166832.1 hypothetical protein [Rhizobium sp. L245/93]MBO9182804.1 hypothetical protein [Rhizobium sp. E27B/91]QXZ82703.1 hypothetical protein J5287_11415 [Rhizobium sp. K1/93]